MALRKTGDPKREALGVITVQASRTRQLPLGIGNRRLPNAAR